MGDLKCGDRVEVFQNSERIESHSYLNKKGIATGKHKTSDYEVIFDDGQISYIYIKDLKIISDQDTQSE
ncbi:hypothetical protein [Clostridium sp. HBUAS56010]|uniref:hypothetical protein n=1 Tax=Clostridium sp. HBUAS56010 TaxID=2571127 RepID=UPI001178562F|nr:hypothetical protein [Clostridium sp. HBUAS56010]